SKYQGYLSDLASMNISADSFAEQIRQNLINQQLNQILLGSEIALPTEIKQKVALLSQERTVRYAALKLKSIEALQKVTDAELKDYYDANSKRFIAPENVKVSYLKMDAEDELKNVTVSD
ncbi:peptidylprolyl isomerase, partial [Escherichia coli]